MNVDHLLQDKKKIFRKGDVPMATVNLEIEAALFKNSQKQRAYPSSRWKIKSFPQSKTTVVHKIALKSHDHTSQPM